MYRAIVIAGGCALLLAAQSGHAGSPNGSAQTKPKVITPATLPPAPLTATQFLQRNVVDAKGVKIAKLDELVVDNAGEIRYVILSYGGILAVTKQHILVPWQALHISLADPGTVTLDMSTAELKRAPRIDKSIYQQDWGNLDAVNWRDVDRFYIKMYASRGDDASSLKSQFELIDRDRNRYISKKEAAQIPVLSRAFNRADTNHDSRLDEGEFARFETGGAPPPSRGGNAGASGKEAADPLTR